MRRLVFAVGFFFLTFLCLAQTSDWFSRGRRGWGYEARMQEAPEVGPPTNEYTFARLVYSGGRGWHYDSWTTDAPKADITFVAGIKRLTNLDVRESPFFIPLTSEEIFKYPFLYAVEVGYLQLSDEEADTLREYLTRGGFLVVDDFHGSYEWANFEEQLRKVFPNCKIEDLPLSHPVFHCFFDVKELIQVPGIQYLYSGRPYEKDGFVPHFRGVFDDTGRLMVMINFNSDIGDAWEWADYPPYPEKWSSTAYRLGINYIIYAMTH
ncbi:MAG TPA: DUF4159 domain-containing protein [Acidobacteriota bacterium]|nr:DUF4159 domain-containing protein [Acidobacteriota bacterium]